MDSVPLNSETSYKNIKFGVNNVKLIFILFILFLVVVSDMMTTSVLQKFGESAVKLRSPTSFGVILQGIFLVIGYVIAIYLINQDII